MTGWVCGHYRRRSQTDRIGTLPLVCLLCRCRLLRTRLAQPDYLLASGAHLLAYTDCLCRKFYPQRACGAPFLNGSARWAIAPITRQLNRQALVSPDETWGATPFLIVGAARTSWQHLGKRYEAPVVLAEGPIYLFPPAKMERSKAKP